MYEARNRAPFPKGLGPTTPSHAFSETGNTAVGRLIGNAERKCFPSKTGGSNGTLSKIVRCRKTVVPSRFDKSFAEVIHVGLLSVMQCGEEGFDGEFGEERSDLLHMRRSSDLIAKPAVTCSDECVLDLIQDRQVHECFDRLAILMRSEVCFSKMTPKSFRVMWISAALPCGSIRFPLQAVPTTSTVPLAEPPQGRSWD